MAMPLINTLVLPAHDGPVTDDDPAARPRRRTFTPEYKLAILEAYDALSEPGAKGALLRREGLHSSHIVEWRKARDAGALAALAAQGRKGRSPEAKELDRTKAALDVVGKAYALLELLSTRADFEGRSTK